jgi:hypothetical protein
MAAARGESREAMIMQCEYQYTQFEKAVGHTKDARLGHCTLEADGGDFEGQHYCLDHLTILKDEAQRYQEFING